MNPPTNPPRSNLTTRILSAAVLVPVALGAVWFGGLPFAVFTAVVGVAMAWEWCRIAFEPNGFSRYLPVFAGAAALSAFLGTVGTVPNFLVVLAVFYLTGIVLSMYRGAGGLPWVVLGMPYICAPLFALVSLRGGSDLGFACVLWLLLVIWTTDTAAYFTGRTLGGPKLAPAISPKKTWSGACGGVLGAVIVGYVFALVWGLPGAGAVAVVSAAISIVGQAGDLIESAFKRRFGVKDSGALIPGHGGALDRMDSLITASLAAWLIGMVHGGYGSVAQGVLIW